MNASDVVRSLPWKNINAVLAVFPGTDYTVVADCFFGKFGNQFRTMENACDLIANVRSVQQAVKGVSDRAVIAHLNRNMESVQATIQALNSQRASVEKPKGWWSWN